MATLNTWPTARTDADETKWSRMISLQRADGVYKNVANTTDFAPSSDGTVLGCQIGAGDCIVGGFHGQSTIQQTVQLDNADASNPRIDLVVLRLDRTSPATISLLPITGQPAVTPAVPALTSTATITDIPVAQIYVGARVAVVAPNMVTDVREFTSERLLGTITPATLGAGAAANGNAGIPADALHVHPLDAAAIMNLIIPAGLIAPFAGSSPPAGWLLCDGSAVNRATYPALYAAIATTYGSGDGITTFNLPDPRGRVLVGIDGAHTLGNSGGSTTHTMTLSELVNHTHGIGGDTGFRIGVSASSVYGFSTTAIAQQMSLTSLDHTGGSQPFSIEQPWLAINQIIKAH